MEIPREYTSNDFFSERQAPFWWPVERIERILERQRMVLAILFFFNFF